MYSIQLDGDDNSCLNVNALSKFWHLTQVIIATINNST